MHTIRVAVLTLCCVVLAPLTAVAQEPILPGQKLAFDHDGVGVVRWEQRVDTGAWTEVVASRVGTTQEWRVPFLPLASGPRSVAMRACYSADVCSVASAPLAVVSIVVVAPTGLRIATEPTP